MIVIDKKRVMDEVARISAYHGTKGSDESAYERMAVIPADAALLSGFMRECIGEIDRVLRRRCIAVSQDDEAVRVEVRLPPGIDDERQRAVSDELTAYMVNALTAGWMEITANDRAEQYARKAARCLDMAARKVMTKNAPRRAL